MVPILRNSEQSRRPLSAAVNTVSGLIKKNTVPGGDERNRKHFSGVK